MYLQQVFDGIYRKILKLKILKNEEIPSELIILMRKTLASSQAKVAIENNKTKTFNDNRNVRQADAV
jgi:hypothetical protein